MKIAGVCLDEGSGDLETEGDPFSCGGRKRSRLLTSQCSRIGNATGLVYSRIEIGAHGKKSSTLNG